MCFTPKVKTPAPTAPTIEPTPLAEEVKGVQFGGASSESTPEATGRKQLKVEKATGSSQMSRAMSRTGVNLQSKEG